MDTQLHRAVAELQTVHGVGSEADTAISVVLKAYQLCRFDTQICEELNFLGVLALSLPSSSAATTILDAAASLATELGAEEYTAKALHNLGIAYQQAGRIERAVEAHIQALSLQRRIGTPRGRGECHVSLGQIELEDGRYAKARRHLAAALALFTAEADPHGEAAAAHALAICLQDQGALDSAHELFARAVDLWRTLGFSDGLVEALQGLGETYHALRCYPLAAHCHLEALHLLGDTQEMTGVAESIEAIAAAATWCGHIVHAIFLFAAVDAIAERYDLRQGQPQHYSRERNLSEFAVTASSYRDIWRAGARCRLGSAIAAASSIGRRLEVDKRTTFPLIANSISRDCDARVQAQCLAD